MTFATDASRGEEVSFARATPHLSASVKAGNRPGTTTSTDVSEVARGACPCGGGEIIVYLETPDHGWSSRQWQRRWGEITCGTCATEFVVQISGRVRLVRRSDLEAQRRKVQEWTTQSDLVLQSEGAITLFQRLVARLKAERSVAAVWRCLSHYGMTQYSESAFRKHWKDAEDWVKENKGIWLLERILAHIPVQPTQVH